MTGAVPLVAGVLMTAGARAQVTINTTQTTSQDLDTLCGGGCPATGSATITNAGNVSNNAGTAVTASARPWSVLNQGTLSSTAAATAALLLNGFAGTVVNAGSISGLAANGFGVRLNAGGVVTNQATGAISGRSGIIIVNGNGTVTNAGTINANVEGVYGTGTGSLTLTNTGSINGSVGVFTTQANASVTNAAGGRITSSSSSGVLMTNGGAVTNDGTIAMSGASATQAGVRIIGGSGATFTNTGSVSGANGFLTDRNNAVISNTGTVAGTNGPGLSITGNTATVTNGGAITGSAGTALAFGGGANNLTLMPGYSFTGNVTGGANNALTLGGASGSASFAADQLGGGLQFQNFTTFQKTGASAWTLTGAAPGALNWTVGAGTLTGTTANLTGNIANNGAVVFDQSSNGTYAGVMSGTGSMTKQGTGTVTFTGANTYSGGTTLAGGTLALGAGASFGSGPVTFSGGALDVSALGTTLTLLNVSGTGSVALGATSLILSQTSDTTFAGGITGTNTISKTGAGTLILNGDSSGFTGTTMISAGTLKVGDIATPSARLGGNVVVASSGILQGHGTIGGGVSNAGRVSPGGTIGTLTVSGNFTQSSGGTLAIELSPSATSKLVVGGSAALAGTLALTLLAGTYVKGATYQILTAGAGVTGTFGTVTGATLNLLQSLGVRYAAGEVSLVVEQASLATVTTTGNQQQVAVALDAANLTAAMPLFALTTAAGLRDAIDRVGVAAEGYGNLASVALRTGQAISGLVGNQMAMTRGGGPATALADGMGVTRVQLASLDPAAQYAQAPASRVEPSSPWSAWLSGFGNFGTIGGDGNAHTLTYTTGGTAFGVDYKLDRSWLVGGFGAYGNSGTGASGLPGSGMLDTYATGVYASWSDGRTYVDGTLGYAYNDERLRRTIAFPGFTALAVRGSTHAHQALGAVEAGRRYGIGEGVTVTPFAGFAATTLDQAGFTETGAGSLSLAVRGQTTSSVRSQLGARVDHVLDLGEGMTLTSGLKLAWAHELADTNSTTSANFVGAANARFAVQGAGRGRDSALVGVGSALKLDAMSSLYVRYDGDLNGADNVHAVTGGVRLTW